MRHSVSVIMPTFNRSHCLALTASALLNEQEVSELIVVDDCSSDSTPQLVQEMAARNPGLRVIRNGDRKGSAFSRNVGLEAASGTSVLMLDDDILMERGSLSVLCSHREAQQSDAVSSRVILLRSGESPDSFSRRRPGSTLMKPGTLEVDFECHPGGDVPTVLTTPVMLFDRESVRGLRYDTRLRGNAWREETDFQIQYARAGRKMTYCPHAVGYHLPPAGGGQRSIGRLKYELSIFKNNFYFSGKQRDYLSAAFPGLPWISHPLLWALKCEWDRAAGYATLALRRLFRR